MTDQALIQICNRALLKAIPSINRLYHNIPQDDRYEPIGKHILGILLTSANGKFYAVEEFTDFTILHEVCRACMDILRLTTLFLVFPLSSMAA